MYLRNRGEGENAALKYKIKVLHAISGGNNNLLPLEHGKASTSNFKLEYGDHFAIIIMSQLLNQLTSPQRLILAMQPSSW